MIESQVTFRLCCFLVWNKKSFTFQVLYCLSLLEWLWRFLIVIANCFGTSMQVDQLALEELVRERFPKLGPQWYIFLEYTFNTILGVHIWMLIIYVTANHLDYLGVQVAWVTGPWFLSIFVNILPWESGMVFLVLHSPWLLDYFHITVSVYSAKEFGCCILSEMMSSVQCLRCFSSSCVGCTTFWWQPGHAIPNCSCLNGIIWY